MSSKLCISVTFLDPYFHGKTDGNQPEWPPSPMRIFQALVAGMYLGRKEISDDQTKALEWLEGQNPPIIIAPQKQRLSQIAYFVPNNDGDKEFDRQGRTRKQAWPQRLDGDTIHYVWSVDSSNTQNAEVIGQCARNIVALGWGIDQAFGYGRLVNETEVANLNGVHWRPYPTANLPSWVDIDHIEQTGGQILRVPQKGSMADLRQVYNSFINRISRGGGRIAAYNPPRKLQVFNLVLYNRVTSLPHRFYAAFELPKGVAFLQEQTSKIAAMLRSLACKRSKGDSHKFPNGSEVYVAGHIKKGDQNTPPRFSYLPLPSIGHEYADGKIRRLLIAEPYGGDGSCAHWAKERLKNQVLRDSQNNEQEWLLSSLWRPTSKQMVERYTKESKHWFSVTPVILPGFDDGQQIKAEKLLFKAIKQAGLPVETIQDIVLRQAPFWTGSLHPKYYFRPDYLRHLPAWHVSISFREPVCGPMALGAGRHCGLGIFAHKDCNTSI